MSKTTCMVAAPFVVLVCGVIAATLIVVVDAYTGEHIRYLAENYDTPLWFDFIAAVGWVSFSYDAYKHCRDFWGRRREY